MVVPDHLRQPAASAYSTEPRLGRCLGWTSVLAVIYDPAKDFSQLALA